MKKAKGITLIALVITVVILIILAGFAINLTIGENGIFSKAKYARDKYLNEESLEQQQLNELYAYLGAEDLPENTKDTDAGTIVRLPDEWQTGTPRYVETDTGIEVISSKKVANVYAVSAGNGETVPVPVGFWYVGGNLSTGVVISSEKADSYLENKRDMTSHDDAINLIGNQFVWIPCTEENYVKTTTYGSNAQNANWDTITNSAELTQIKKYGGFYVSRYEAGLPEGTTEFTGSVSYTSDTYNMLGNPQSRAGVSPWNFVDWEKSQINARSMYNTTYVHSGLITGTQWDVMINKIGSLKDESGNTKYSLTNSASWGNYYDGDTNGFTFRGDVSEYKSNTQYAFTTPASTTKANNTYYLLKTGASDHNLAYNLYDVAGNLWEWTEEISTYATTGQYRVLRGSGFDGTSSTHPVCFRHGRHTVSSIYSSVGFRVVLYIK